MRNIMYKSVCFVSFQLYQRSVRFYALHCYVVIVAVMYIRTIMVVDHAIALVLNSSQFNFLFGATIT